MSTTTGGTAAPDFSLPDDRGGTVHLAGLAGQGPVLLVFYRGDWCSYCNTQLAAIAEQHPALEALGIRVLAISVDDPVRGAALRTSLSLPFSILSDPDHAVIDRYAGVEPNLRQGVAIGRPATYLVDSLGRIAWSHIGADHRDRPQIEVVLEQARLVAGL